ncbi:MAG: LysR family transcriptional regulator [Dethiobacteria bacterium]
MHYVNIKTKFTNYQTIHYQYFEFHFMILSICIGRGVFMTLTQLECFIAVAETLSFTKAAQKLSFVQSAVSSKIAELEKRVGCRVVYTHQQIRPAYRYRKTVA